MKKDELERLIGRVVTIILLDGDEITGELHKTGEELFKNNASLYIPRKRYTLIKQDGNNTCVFRSSHVKKLYLNIGGIDFKY